MADTLTKEVEKQDLELLKPSKYKVVVLNDDKTPIDFVIAMLIRVFKHTHAGAEKLTMQIHNDGSAIAGIYTHEVAEQKCVEGVNLAREHGFPLVIKTEPE